MDNQDNDELLEGLRPGEKVSPPSTSTGSNPSVNNDALLTGLQQGSTPQPSSVSQPNPSLSQSVPASAAGLNSPAQPFGVSKSVTRKRNVFIILGAAALVCVLALVSGVVLTSMSDSQSPAATGSAPETAPPIVSTDPIPDTPAPVTTDTSLFTPPADVPAIIETVRSRTVMFECVPVRGGDGSQGSGFLLDISPLAGGTKDVFITNEHVISDCINGGSIEAIYGGRSYPATIVSSDKKWDLAIMEIPSLTSLTPLRMASENASAGQWVMAVGSPLGVQDSVSFGYVSNIVKDENYISSDAVLGPGNSGGPLTNNQGDVLGVNTAVWEEATGISLTRPLDALCIKLLQCM